MRSFEFQPYLSMYQSEVRGGMGQESNKYYELGLVRQKSEVSREQERVKSMVLGKAEEINRILKVKAVQNPTAQRI